MKQILIMALLAILLVGCNTIPVYFGMIYTQNVYQPDNMSLLSLINQQK